MEDRVRISSDGLTPQLVVESFWMFSVSSVFPLSEATSRLKWFVDAESLFLLFIFFETFQAQWSDRPKDSQGETAGRSTITAPLLEGRTRSNKPETLSGSKDNQIQTQPRDGRRASKTGQ